MLKQLKHKAARKLDEAVYLLTSVFKIVFIRAILVKKSSFKVFLTLYGSFEKIWNKTLFDLRGEKTWFVQMWK